MAFGAFTYNEPSIRAHVRQNPQNCNETEKYREAKNRDSRTQVESPLKILKTSDFYWAIIIGYFKLYSQDNQIHF